MSPLAHTLVDEVMQLPKKDRADLALYLLRSLEQKQDDNVVQVWKEEIHKRARDLDDGHTTSHPWAEVKERLNNAFQTEC